MLVSIILSQMLTSFCINFNLVVMVNLTSKKKLLRMGKQQTSSSGWNRGRERNKNGLWLLL